MKKGIIALVILLLCAFVYQANATTYFGCAAQEITAAGTFEDAAGCDGTALTWASLANGDILVANNQAITIANDIGSAILTATLTTEGTDYGGTDGGSFTFDISAATAKTLYVNVVAGSTVGLTVTGAGAGADTTELTINGNITGGTATSAYGVRLEHTLGVIPITGTLTGGAGTTAHAVHSATAGKFTVTGNATGVKGNGINSSDTSIFTVSGNCVADTGTSAGVGCHCGASTGYCTLTGNIVNGPRSVGATGAVRYTPTAPSDGVTGHYVKYDGGGTALFFGKNTDDASKALTDFYYIDPTDGGSDVGTSSGGGGGAWAN